MLNPGTLIYDRYRVMRLLGQGGMSNVYVCQDTHLGNRILAVKEFTAKYDDASEQAKILAYFTREAQLLSTLRHPNLPIVSDYVQYQGKYYLAMDYVEGEDLGKILSRTKGAMSEGEVADWSMQVATVLYYLHCHKPEPIIFRDVKPANIILCRGTVKLIDFGIARHFGPGKKNDTIRIGSPGYAPLEQYNGQSDQRSDIYALGATMHQALTGIDPTSNSTSFVLPDIRLVNPAISEDMVRIVERATKREPKDRYQSMLDMKRDIQKINNRIKNIPVKSSNPSLTTLMAPGIVTQTSKNKPTDPLNLAAGVLTNVVSNTNNNSNNSSKKSGQNKSNQGFSSASQKQSVAPTPKIVVVNGSKPKSSFYRINTFLMFTTTLMCFVILVGAYFNFIKMPIDGAKIEDCFNMYKIGYYPKMPQNAKESYLLGASEQASIEDLTSAIEANPEDYCARIFLNNFMVGDSNSNKVNLAVILPNQEKSGLKGVYFAQKAINERGGLFNKPLYVTPYRLTGDPSGYQMQTADLLAGKHSRIMYEKDRITLQPPQAVLVLNGDTKVIYSVKDTVAKAANKVPVMFFNWKAHKANIKYKNILAKEGNGQSQLSYTLKKKINSLGESSTVYTNNKEIVSLLQKDEINAKVCDLSKNEIKARDILIFSSQSYNSVYKAKKLNGVFKTGANIVILQDSWETDDIELPKEAESKCNFEIWSGISLFHPWENGSKAFRLNQLIKDEDQTELTDNMGTVPQWAAYYDGVFWFSSALCGEKQYKGAAFSIEDMGTMSPAPMQVFKFNHGFWQYETD